MGVLESSWAVFKTVPGFALWATFEGDIEGFRPPKVLFASTVFTILSQFFQGISTGCHKIVLYLGQKRVLVTWDAVQPLIVDYTRNSSQVTLIHRKVLLFIQISINLNNISFCIGSWANSLNYRAHETIIEADGICQLHVSYESIFCL